VCAACLTNFVRKFVEKIYKMRFLEGSGVPVLTYRTHYQQHRSLMLVFPYILVVKVIIYSN
jgi:hypothetical protein